MIDIDKFEGFEWDERNVFKNWKSHKVTYYEAEETFYNTPLFTAEDTQHSTEREQRFFCMGKTNNERKLHIIFTVRNNRIRIISARDMSKKERKFYYEKIKENT